MCDKVFLTVQTLRHNGFPLRTSDDTVLNNLVIIALSVLWQRIGTRVTCATLTNMC